MSDDIRSASLESTDGWTRVALSYAKVPTTFAVTVHITTRFWNRSDALSDADIVPDAEARVRDIALDASAVSRFAADLQCWVSLPLAALASTEFQGEYSLAADTGQTLTFRFRAGRRPGQVAVAVDVAQERMASGVKFSADVTGCEALATGLAALVSTWEPSTG